MKKSKIGIFAVLGVLSLSAVAVGVTVAEISPQLASYDATVPCTLTWKQGQAPTLTSGSGTYVNSHVETSYKKASVIQDGHIQLGLGGVMQTSGKAWDGNVGGYVNGLTSLTVTFETTAFYDDSVLLLSAGFHGYSDVKSSYHLKSGEEITFDESFLPRSFKLEYKAQDYDAIDSVAKITSIVAKCSMVESYGVTLQKTDKAIDYKTLIWSKGQGAGTAIDRDKLNKLQLKAGDVIAIRTPDGAKAYLTKEDLVVTGGTVTSQKFAENDYETIFITCNDHLTIEVATHHDAPIYQGRAFVGTYGVINLATKEQTTLTLDEFGKLTIGGKTYDYTADAKDKITLANSSDTFAHNHGYIRTKLNNTVYIGAKGSTVTFPVLKTSGTGEYIDIIAKIGIDGGTPNYVHIYRSGILVSGTNDITITEEKAGIANLDVVKITTTTPAGREAMFDQGNFNSGKAYESGNETTIYFTVSGDTLTLVEALDEAGTYTSDGNPDLVLDIFGTVSFGPLVKENAFNKKNSEVDLDNYILVLDTASKTYVEKVIYNGEQWTTPTTYKLSTGTDTLTFNNGTVTIETTKSLTKKTGTYTVVNSIVKFDLEATPLDESPTVSNIPAKFELELSPDKSSLKVIKAETIDGWHGYTIYAKGSEFKIPQEVVDPWLTQAGVYSDGTQTITLQAGKITLTKKYNLDKATVDYTYDGENILATFSVYDLELGPTSLPAKFKIAPDLSSITGLIDVYDGGMGSNEVIGENVVYTYVSGPTK